MILENILNDEKLNKLLEDSISKTYYKYIWNNSYLRDLIDKDDFTQECYIFLMKHIQTFDNEKSSLNTYIPMVVVSSAKNQIRTIKRNKRELMNNSVSLSIEINHESSNNNTLETFISDEKTNLEIDSINNIYIEEILKSEILSELERKILVLLLKEYSCEDIGKILNYSRRYMSKKCIDIRRKLVPTL